MHHRELDAWKEAMALTEDVYAATSGFPPTELYGLTTQMRRAAVSVPSNISEGAGRNSRKEFFHFLGVALGSLAELETQVILSQRLGYLENTSLLDRLGKVRSLILGLKRSLQ
jgi:four helix bundle protein